MLAEMFLRYLLVLSRVLMAIGIFYLSQLMSLTVSVVDFCHYIIANSERYKGRPMPDKFGTVQVRWSVVLEPRCEHLVGK